MFQLLYDKISIGGCEDEPSLCVGMKFFKTIEDAKTYVNTLFGLEVKWQKLGKIEISQEISGIIFSITETTKYS